MGKYGNKFNKMLWSTSLILGPKLCPVDVEWIAREHKLSLAWVSEKAC